MTCDILKLGGKTHRRVHPPTPPTLADLAERLARIEAKLQTPSEALLKDLVEALDKAFISSWQSTFEWQAQLDAARAYLETKS